MQISLQTAYKNLCLLDQVDIATSASYRQLAQDILADPSISLEWRQAISDRLNRANYLLTLVTVSGDDSY
ncbi:hypothetical protein [Leptolyngbya sp. FACHB-711]|uniref:hypothetical protein n=1 Tax=unclassified Leptolyngbya TaxID=2650499 RepID=UPI001687982A|nr:hypothetical protein [Leptolyngbya sp. FACHB-711]MBD1852868.1 hypothetical protein [Cyanobacteria bacterium FACHB-502]MBD2027190.1 hypothetical protein [Leptolyngbya sp. FACHB-711]